MSEPRSPRQRYLQDDEAEGRTQAGHDLASDPTQAARAAAEEAALNAREQAQPPYLDPDTWLEGDEIPPPETESLPFETQTSRADPPEVLTLLELSRILDGLIEGSGEDADDLLQGATMVLGMGYTGEVQIVVLRILQTYREITERR